MVFKECERRTFGERGVGGRVSQKNRVEVSRLNSETAKTFVHRPNTSSIQGFRDGLESYPS